MKYLLYFFLLSVTVSGLVFTACGQEGKTSANKAWVKDEVSDSLTAERAARSAADLLKISISDSATYFYKRGYLDAVHASKLNTADTSSLASDAQISALESKKFNTVDTTAFNSKTLTTAQLATKFNTADTTAFNSKALATAQLAYKLNLSGGTMSGDLDIVGAKITADSVKNNSDSTIIMICKDLVLNDSLYLFTAWDDLTITSITSARMLYETSGQVEFTLYYGSSLFGSGTTLGGLATITADTDGEDYVISSSNTITSGQPIWLRVTDVETVCAYLEFKFNYTEN